MNDITEAEFYDRCDRAFDPHACRSLIAPDEISLGPTDDQWRARNDAIIAQLDDLDSIVPYAPTFTDAEIEAARAECPATPIIPAYISRYDRQIKKRAALEAEIADLDSNAPRYHQAMSELVATRDRIKIELKRSTDDQFRERERIDEWKLTIGKDERNASRRNRPVANAMTPKEVLATETPEEKAARKRKRDTELKRIKRAKK